MAALDGIHVTEWGAGGPAVVMIHGGPQGSPAGGSQEFAAQRPLTQCGWRLVLPDRPGHGQTPSRGPEDMEVDAVWVTELLGDGAHLVGHSFGGCVALAAAALRPEAVISLTLVEPPLFPVAAPDPDVAALSEELHRLHGATDMDPIPRLVAFSRAVAIPSPPSGTAPPADVLARMGEGLSAMRPPDAWDCRPAVQTVADAGLPVLVITGGWGRAFGAVGDAVARITGGEHRVVASGHHFPHRRAEEFNAVLDAFMTRAGRTESEISGTDGSGG
ncbi:MAG: alpha/beta hydrolase [Solirubrobacteraceae bacterium]